MAIAGEAVRFDLSAYRSTVTREMAQMRVRMTARSFKAGADLVPANLVDGGAALEVHAAALTGANDITRSRLEAGPESAVLHLREMATTRALLDQVASTFARTLVRGDVPRVERLVAYLTSSAHYQALGALKFCLPDGVRPRLETWLGEPALVDAVLAPDEPTLWSTVHGRELALARVRLRGPAADYRRRLARHRREVGYLGAEDVDFGDHESLDAIDGRLAVLGAGGAPALAAERRRLSAALAAGRAGKAKARQALADRLAAGPAEDDVARVLSHVLLIRGLTAHEDVNRRAKMRLLRDLRDLADIAGMNIATAELTAFAAACGRRRPVLRSA